MTESASGSKDGDVLSSIRRLVSTRPEGAAVAFGGQSRLLLTPALRVANTPDTAPAETPPAPARVLSLEERIAELEAAVSSDAAEWEPDGSEAAAQETPDTLPQALNPTPDPTPTHDAEAPIEIAAEERAEDEIDRPEAESVVRLHLASAAPAEDETPVAPATFRSTHRSPEPVAETASEGIPALREDGTFDEEALRGIVTAVVREELQGQFGERITRGIRRMVRREIEKALTARELD